MGNMTSYDPKVYWELRGEEWTGDVSEVIVNKVMPLIGPGSIIDVGCGYGRWYPLIGEGRDYLGIDIAQSLIDRFKEEHPEANAVVGDIRDFRAGRSFDVGLSWTVLEHVPPADLEAAKDSMWLLAKRWLLVEPWVPKFKRHKLVPHCFGHDYEITFPIHKVIDLEPPLKLYEVRF